jgi:uncharacterized repeat protein (TIGR03803 family)
MQTKGMPSRNLSAVRLFVGAFLVIASVFAPNVWAAGKYKTLHRFINSYGGRLPTAGVVFDRAGNLYGTTNWDDYGNPGSVFELKPTSKGFWRESVLYVFNGGGGTFPQGNLILDQAGNLYGTTIYGGAHNSGTVFELSHNPNGSWTETVLHSFAGGDDGLYPVAGLVFDRAGNLYGTTAEGGTGDEGTVFRLKPNPDGSWMESVLFSFCCGDGGLPQAGLILDQAGNLYGTTSFGGANGWGVVFKLTPNPGAGWKESVLYSFCAPESCGDGSSPVASLILDASGNLYGTTNYGGNNICSAGRFKKGCGTVFKLTPNPNGTWTESVLYRFRGRDGKYPVASLVMDGAGNLYGTTMKGGKTSCNGSRCGVVFELTPSSQVTWKETLLHRFSNHPGAYPYAGLAFDSSGKLYGTTYGDDGSTFGSVFEIAP